MSDTDAISAGRYLAQRHENTAVLEPGQSLLDYAESTRPGDWTLRSALVRLAQPEPQRAGVVLELVRRCDAALRPLARSLERHTTITNPGLTMVGLLGAAEADDYPSEGDGKPDARVADLARLALDDPDRFPAVLEAYRNDVELDDEEIAAIPLLELALPLDELADRLAAWAANQKLPPPPIDVIDAISATTFKHMEEIGVAREEPPPGFSRGQRRR